MPAIPPLSATIVAGADHASCELGGETVILDVRTGMYFGLDRVATRIWEFIREPRTVAEVRGMVSEWYAIDPQRAERDVLALVVELRRHALIDVHDGTASQVA